jgi:F-type H+-transporting ATPase subunit b
MLFDWFTFGAQVLNFLILVWVLKRFLYKPILNAIDAREKLIAKELANAAASKAEARKAHEEFQHKNEVFDKQRAALLSKATDEANAERQRLLGEARKTAEALSAKLQEAMRNNARNLEKALSRRTQEEVFAIARKALTDLAATSLEGRMVEAFTLRLRGMDGRARVHMSEVLKTASEPALVRSAFDLPREQRVAVQKAINETFSADIHLRFETAPDLVSGIDLSAKGERVGWSIENYLTSLEKGVRDLLKEKERPEPKAEPAPQGMTDPNVEPKAEAAVAPGPEATVEPKREATVAPKPDTKSDPKPDGAVAPTPDAHMEPKLAAHMESKSESAKVEPQSP